MSDSRTTIRNENFKSLTLGDDELTGDHFFGSVFVQVNFGDNADIIFEGCRFDGCIFEGDLSGSQFLRCNIDGCVFRNATLDDVGFLESNLSDSAFQTCSLFGSVFSESLMSKARIQDCDARSSVFENCSLDGVLFDDTNLSDAHLSSSFGLEDGQLDAALGDRRTTIPPGVLRPEHWDRDEVEPIDEFADDVGIPSQVGAPLRVLWKGQKLIPDPRGGGAETLRTLHVSELFKNLREDVEEISQLGPHNHPIFRYLDRLHRELSKGVTLANPVSIGYQVELIKTGVPEARDSLVESTCSMLDGVVTGGELFAMQFSEWREITQNLDSRTVASPDGVISAQLYNATSALRKIARGIRENGELIDRRIALTLEDHADDLMGSAASKEVKISVAKSSSNLLSALLSKVWIGVREAAKKATDETVRYGVRRFIEDHASQIRDLVALAPNVLKWVVSILDKLMG